MLKGKNVLITGSTRGIGWAIANSLADKNANVIVTGRGKTAHHKLQPNMSYYQVDFANYDEVSSFRKQLKSDGISIDVLINNAGNTIVNDYKEMTIEDFDISSSSPVRRFFTLYPFCLERDC